MIAPRRAFLRGLAALPFVGGSVAIIGAPSAVAVPITLPLLDRYADWLAVEYGECLIERSGLLQPDNADHAMNWRREWCRENPILNPNPVPDLGSRRFMAPPTSAASTRATLVLGAVGVDWRGGEQ